MEKVSQLVARIFLGQIFLLSGLNKISGYDGTLGYMNAMGIPDALLPLAILLEVGGSLAIMAGWQTRWISLALAAFTVVAGIIFHSNFSDQIQMIMFMKNIAIAGGLILLSVQGAGAYNLDNYRALSARPENQA